MGNGSGVNAMHKTSLPTTSFRAQNWIIWWNTQEKKNVFKNREKNTVKDRNRTVSIKQYIFKIIPNKSKYFEFSFLNPVYLLLPQIIQDSFYDVLPYTIEMLPRESCISREAGAAILPGLFTTRLIPWVRFRCIRCIESSLFCM